MLQAKNVSVYKLGNYALCGDLTDSRSFIYTLEGLSIFNASSDFIVFECDDVLPYWDDSLDIYDIETTEFLKSLKGITSNQDTIKLIDEYLNATIFS